MKHHTLLAALLALCFFVVGGAASAAVDSTAIHQPAVELSAPSPDPVIERLAAENDANFTAYQNNTRDGGSSLPWGDLVAEIINAFGALVLGVVIWAFRKLPSEAVSAINAVCLMLWQKQANELLGHAVQYGLNVTAGAVKGKRLDFKTGSAVLERATDFAADRAPWFTKVILGGAANVRQMIAARLDLDEDVELPLAKPPADATFATKQAAGA